MVKDKLFSSTLSPIRTCVAPACFTTLLSDSCTIRNRGEAISSGSGTSSEVAVTSQAIWCRCENSPASICNAGTNPKSSSGRGRRSDDIRRTEVMALSNSVSINAAFFSSAGISPGNSFRSRVRSILTAPSVWPRSSCSSRAIRLRSCSRIVCRLSKRSRRYSRESLSSCSARFRSVMSRKITV